MPHQWSGEGLHGAPSTIGTYSLTIGSSGTPPTKGASPAADSASYFVIGKLLVVFYTYSDNNSSGAAAGTGTYTFPVPAGYTIDTAKLSTAATLNRSQVGYGSVGSSAQGNDQLKVYMYDSSNVWCQGHANGTVGGTNYSLNAASLNLTFVAILPIT